MNYDDSDDEFFYAEKMDANAELMKQREENNEKLQK